MKKLLSVTLAIVVGIIMVGSLLVPVITDTTNNDLREKINNGSIAYRASSDESVTFSGSTGNSTGTMGDETIQFFQNGALQIITTDVFVLQELTNYAIRADYIENGVIVSDSEITNVSVTVTGNTISATYLTADGTEKNVNLSIEWGFWATNEPAEYVFYASYAGSSVKVNDLDQIYSSGYIGMTSGFFTISNGNLEVNGADNDTLTWEPTKINGYTDYFEFVYSSTSDNLSFVVDNGGSDYTVHPYYIIAPKTIFVTPIENDTPIALLFAIPVLFLVALVAIAANLIRRD